MKKCPKTTSGKHYWYPTAKSFDKGEHTVWLDGNIEVRCDMTCLACGIIDDKKYINPNPPTYMKKKTIKLKSTKQLYKLLEDIQEELELRSQMYPKPYERST